MEKGKAPEGAAASMVEWYNGKDTEEFENPIPILKEILEELENKLIAYTKKPDANRGYIERNYLLIKKLEKVLDLLRLVEPLDVWVVIRQTIETYRLRGTECDGFNIILPTTPNPKTNRYIHIDFGRAAK